MAMRFVGGAGPRSQDVVAHLLVDGVEHFPSPNGHRVRASKALRRRTTNIDAPPRKPEGNSSRLAEAKFIRGADSAERGEECVEVGRVVLRGGGTAFCRGLSRFALLAPRRPGSLPHPAPRSGCVISGQIKVSFDLLTLFSLVLACARAFGFVDPVGTRARVGVGGRRCTEAMR